MAPKASVPPLVQQARNDDVFDIEGNFKRGIGEELDKHFEEQYQQRRQAEIDAGAVGGCSGQYGAQAPAPY